MGLTHDRLRRAAALVRQIEWHGCPMAILVDHRGNTECIKAGSVRHVAMQQSTTWQARIKGVFSPGVTAAVLAREVFGA